VHFLAFRAFEMRFLDQSTGSPGTIAIRRLYMGDDICAAALFDDSPPGNDQDGPVLRVKPLSCGLVRDVGREAGTVISRRLRLTHLDYKAAYRAHLSVAYTAAYTAPKKFRALPRWHCIAALSARQS
jgi:hypothetical protein